MFDQHNAYTNVTTPVHDLVAFEKTMQCLGIEKPVQVRWLKNGNGIEILHDGLLLTGKVDRPLIHQLGGRAWKNSPNFKAVNELWLEKFKTNPAALAQELADVFTRYNLIIRYHASATGINQIYGIVTDRFVDVNQVEFRQNFLEQAHKITGLTPKSTGFREGNHGTVIENFKFDNFSGFQTDFKYGLVYARNNGYEAYKVDWQRYVLICSNGLKSWKGDHDSWKHTNEFDLSEFITSTIKEGVGNQQFLEQRITASRAENLNKMGIDALLARMSLAKASKDRVMQRIDIEAKAVGFNEWALSQSLTWLGTHEKGIQKRNQRQLIGLGTDILEHSLAEVLKEESQLYYDGSYGLMLPKGFKRGIAA